MEKLPEGAALTKLEEGQFDVSQSQIFMDGGKNLVRELFLEESGDIKLQKETLKQLIAKTKGIGESTIVSAVNTFNTKEEKIGALEKMVQDFKDHWGYVFAQPEAEHYEEAVGRLTRQFELYIHKAEKAITKINKIDKVSENTETKETSTKIKKGKDQEVGKIDEVENTHEEKPEPEIMEEKLPEASPFTLAETTPEPVVESTPEPKEKESGNPETEKKEVVKAAEPKPKKEKKVLQSLNQLESDPFTPEKIEDLPQLISFFNHELVPLAITEELIEPLLTKIDDLLKKEFYTIDTTNTVAVRAFKDTLKNIEQTLSIRFPAGKKWDTLVQNEPHKIDFLNKLETILGDISKEVNKAMRGKSKEPNTTENTKRVKVEAGSENEPVSVFGPNIKSTVELMTQDAFIFGDQENSHSVQEGLDVLKKYFNMELEKVGDIEKPEGKLEQLEKIKNLFVTQKIKIETFTGEKTDRMHDLLDIFSQAISTIDYAINAVTENMVAEEKEKVAVNFDIETLQTSADLLRFFNNTIKETVITEDLVEPLLKKTADILSQEFNSVDKKDSLIIQTFINKIKNIEQTLSIRFPAGKKWDALVQNEPHKTNFLDKLHELFKVVLEDLEERVSKLTQKEGTAKKIKTKEIKKGDSAEEVIPKKSKDSETAPDTKTSKPKPSATRPEPEPKKENEEEVNTPEEEPILAPEEVAIGGETRELTIDQMIEACLIHNESDPSISPEIRDDAGFNSWIERIAKKNHEKNAGYIYTIETWFGEYKKQQEKIQVISDLLRAEAVSLSLFKDFKNPEQIILAKQKMLEKLEWDLIVNTQAAEKKISNILEVKQRVEQNEAHVAKLEKEKTEIVRSLQNKEVKISGELVFNILHGQNAELVKIHDFERFLIDMAQNYEFYHGPLKEKEDMGDMRRMFVLHDKTRKGTYDGNHIKKIGLWGRLTGKLARYRKTGTENYDDLKAFETTIRALEAAEVIPTHTSNKDLAKHNMDNLILLVKKAEDAIANHIPLEDFLHSQGGTEKDRESFLALYNTYIKNKGRNSSMQKLARESDQQGTVVSSINTHLEQAQQRNEELRQEAFETIRGDAGEFDEFAEDVKNEFILDEMNSIIQTLRENKKGDNIEKLNLIAKKLESIQTTGLSDDITLTHRRASLELSQAYIRIVSKKPEGVLAPNNMAYYKKIFESSEQEIPKAKKKEYVVAILQTLKDVLPKKTKTLEKLEIERFIKHFEAIEKTLA